MNLKISVIIPTLNRLDDLKITIKSIEKQVLLPYELIIVDQSDNNFTKNYILNKKYNFKLTYVFQKKKSLTYARNNGVKVAKGDLITFLDDDVTLNKNYFFEIVNSFNEKPNLIGLTGDLKIPFKINFFKKLFNYLFDLIFLNNKLKPFCVSGVFGAQTYLIKPKYFYNKCEWLSGGNSTYRKFIFDEFTFDENLVKYSYKEDVDFSNRVYRKYTNTLGYNPKVVALHRISLKNRLLNKDLIKMKWLYFIYIYLKNNNVDIKFYWSIYGYLFKLFLISLYKFDLNYFKLNLVSCNFVLKNLDSLFKLLKNFD